MGRCASIARAFSRRRMVRGQGMTEYAVLIGVILIVAFVVFLFKDQLAGLFNHATDSISNLNNEMTKAKPA